jgi:hypothetical protein
VNAGVGGYSTDQQYILLQQLLGSHDPSWVVLIFFVNDLLYLENDEAFGMGKPRFEVDDGRVDITALHLPTLRSDSLGMSSINRKVVDCCTYDPLANVLEKVGRTLGARPLPGALLGELQSQIGLTKKREHHYQIGRPEFYTQPERYGSDWSLFFQFLLHIQRQGERDGFQLLVLYLPEIAQIVEADTDPFAPQRYFADRCGHLKIDCLEPHRAFVERQGEGIDLFFMDDGHLSPRGADLVAGILAARLSRTPAR